MALRLAEGLFKRNDSVRAFVILHGSWISFINVSVTHVQMILRVGTIAVHLIVVDG